MQLVVQSYKLLSCHAFLTLAKSKLRKLIGVTFRTVFWFILMINCSEIDCRHASNVILVYSHACTSLVQSRNIRFNRLLDAQNIITQRARALGFQFAAFSVQGMFVQY